MRRSLQSLFVPALAILALALSLGSGAYPAAAEEAAEAPRPKTVLDGAIADLGTVVQGESASHDFILRNEGNAPLEINEVRPDCGCTVTEFDRVIPPGGSGKIRATLDTTGMRGGVSRLISVFTNDPETPELHLTMMVKATSYLLFNPGFARFIKGHGYPPGEVSQFFYSPNFPQVEIEKVDSPFPALKVEYREAAAAERRAEAGESKQYIFTLTFTYDDAPVGPLNGEVVVHTNHPQQKEGRLPVSGFVRPRLAVTPPVADFGEFELAEGTLARFLVHNFTPERIQVTRVETPIAGAKAAISMIEEGRRYHVELVLPLDLPKGPFSSEVKIFTDSPKEPVLVVPVKGTVL